jgi:hypothetical protein
VPVRGLFRSTVVACLLAGVVLVSSGFAVVSGAKVPKPGGVCGKAGARVVSQSVSLVCIKMVSGKLVWRAVKASSTSTTTTTPIAPSTTVAVVPTVSLAATFLDDGTFLKAAVVTSNVAGTVYFIEGASPVNTVSDITSAPYYRWTSGVVSAGTPTSIALDVDVLTNGYYRVFVANSQGVLSEPAFNKVTISISRVSNVVALTCATGGTCEVGETGPGGGVVFYVQAAGGTFACGATLASTCRYLEAAPTSGTAAWTDAQYVWSGNTTIEIGAAAQGVAIGTGLKNTEAMVTQSNTAGRAGTITRAYRGPNNLTDWYLPSIDELNELCKYARTREGQTSCEGTGTSRTGFSAGSYWSSSESISILALSQYFVDGRQSGRFKSNTGYVRPVRAFG